MDFINEVINSLEKLTRRVEVLEKEIAQLKGVDIMPTIEDFESTMVVAQEQASIEAAVEEAVESVEGAADSPAEEVVEQDEEKIMEQVADVVKEEEDVAEESKDEGLPKSLFASESEPEVAVKEEKYHIRSINEARKPETAFMDTMADKFAWKHDMPGSEVKDIRSGIALNDRVQFIRTLFREDSSLYQETIIKLNGMKTIGDVLSYLQEKFPEWKMDSDNVYRFMMAVRRKIR